MKSSRSSLFVLLALALVAPLAMRANPIADHPVFRLFVGEWQGSGEASHSVDGSKVVLQESWTARFTEAGNFIISGKRVLDQNEHDFAWEFYPNGDLVEGQAKMSEPQVDIRFEVEVSEAARSITMKIPLGGDAGTLVIVNTVAEDGQSIEGTIEIISTAGQPTLSGGMTHRRM